MKNDIIEGLTEFEINELFDDTVEIAECYVGTFSNGDPCWVYCYTCSIPYVNYAWGGSCYITTQKGYNTDTSCVYYGHFAGWRN